MAAVMEAPRSELNYSEAESVTTDDYVTPAEDIETPTPRNETTSNAFPFPTIANGSAHTPTIDDAPSPPTTALPKSKNVQFAAKKSASSSDQIINSAPKAPNYTPGTPQHSTPRQASSSFIGKLKHLTPTVHSQNNKGKGLGIDGLEGGGNQLDAAAADMDADAEDSGSNTPRVRSPKRIKPVRLESDARTAPNSPSVPAESLILPRPTRRSTAPDTTQGGVSEDEGRAKLTKSPAWRRQGSAWLHHLYGSPASEDAETLDGQEKSRPRPLMRLSTMGMHASPRPKADLGPRWRQVKAGLKLMGGQKRKSEKITMDQIKSTELMAELLAGSPAALILASRFQRDEHEKRKIPVLLEQLKVNVTDSEQVGSSSDRHLLFRIELEYGNGIMRKKWVIKRRLGDFVALHSRYKLEAQKNRVVRSNEISSSKAKLPHFPRSAFPYLRTIRGALPEESDEEVPALAEEHTAESSATRTATHRQSSTFGLRRRSTTAPEGQEGATMNREAFSDRQRKKLEQYLREMIRYQMFRAGSNCLCKFLELSALGVRLASEGGYQGKEGTLLLQSGSGTDWRRAWYPKLLTQRHRPMWFLVRSSYIACVDSPEAMNIYDCFLVDPSFKVDTKKPRIRDQKGAKDMARTAGSSATHPKHHMMRLYNSERRLKLLAKNQSILNQWEQSISAMMSTTEWIKQHRFDSFAPVRKNVHAQWLVDGRDYMWNVSRAISQAHDVIYIHDWWLSPELYMRRPAAISQKWRLDRLLKRKAEEGVKIFVIMYRNIDAAIPIDSEYSKFSLLDLHPNIFVQRSPNQVRQNVFFWSHHEKICVVDHSIAFCGGVDLCFGRWDTPSHSVVDDKPTGFEPTEGPKDADHCQLWPGKDYSNPRVLDFFKLDAPYEEMYDRSRVPRMPWHDIGMQIVGQPARDLTRHFVQRWNYILRQRTPTRPTPFLLPPSDFTDADLDAMGITGTCEIQMLRSCGEWSIGTPGRTEHSIHNAYIKLIEQSDHFVYLENQFFITSCTVEGTKIHNHVGDALVERIIRAHANGEDWLAILIVPLMPGYANAVDEQDGTSVRLIMQCQFRSICRGSSSIFERLRAEGIDPEDYIRFYALRQWGRIGPTKALVTEQLYIHAKCMVVDDRWAIIGSANINERSLLGDRDSEVAAVIRDNDMIESRMAGRDYKVGRFPHTLRMRLMREHLGIDVDSIMDEERREQFDREEAGLYDGEETDHASLRSVDSDEKRTAEQRHRLQDALIARSDEIHAFNHDADWEQANNPRLLRHKKVTADPRVTKNKKHESDVAGFGFDNMAAVDQQATLGGRDSEVVAGNREVLKENVSSEGRGTVLAPAVRTTGADSSSNEDDNDTPLTTESLQPPWPMERMNTQQMGLPTLSLLPDLPATDDTDLGGPPLQKLPTAISAKNVNPIFASMRRPVIDKNCMRDPVNEGFANHTWHTIAQNNTKLYRQVFRCQPDSEVLMWAQYHAYNDYARRFKASQGMSQDGNEIKGQKGRTGPPGTGSGVNRVADTLKNFVDNRSLAGEGGHASKATLTRPETKDTSESTETEKAPSAITDGVGASTSEMTGTTIRLDEATEERLKAEENSKGTAKRKRRGTGKSRGTFSGTEPVLGRADAEELMKLVQGHIVEWPYDWLAHEERGGKWLYTVDQMAPIEIYD